MAFMYLHLQYVKQESGFGSGVRATVKTEGSLHSLGTENSRWSDHPFAVFALTGFDGLENIDTDTLIELLLQRVSAPELQKRLGWQFSFDELIELLRETHS